jgi:dTDP-4-amino-4,6-dideoxygalactose transaminase
MEGAMDNIRIPLVDLGAQYQSIKTEIDAAIQDVILSGQFIGGDYVTSFGKQFAEACEVPFCIPCANGTDALEMALMALGIGAGDEVIIPAFSFFATLEAVHNVGATPVLCDIDPNRYTLDPVLAISLVNEKTKAFMPVHLYGQMADMDPLVTFALDNNMFVVEDAAQAHRATYRQQRAGSMGDINTFSFYPGKNLGAYGDAGAITTKSEWLYTKSLKMANHGRISKYDHDSMGRNSRMDSIQAAILSVKLKHLDIWIHARQALAKRYTEKLHSLSDVGLPHTSAECQHGFHLYVIRVPEILRDLFRAQLLADGIETGVHYPVSLSKLTATTDVLNIHVECPAAEKASREVVSLPIYPEMTHEQQDRVVDSILSFFAKQA